MRTNTQSVLFCLLLSIIILVRASACTSFCMDTPSGPIFGSNLDLFIPAYGIVVVNQKGMVKKSFSDQKGTTGKELEWVSKYGSVTFNLAGREWCWSGMNEAGLVLGAMELVDSKFPDKDERPGLPIGMWAQYIMDTCGTVSDVAKVKDKVRMDDPATPAHFLIADAKGDCIAIEWIDGKIVQYIGKTMEVKAMANMRYGQGVEAYKRGGPKWWWSNPGQSAERVAGAKQRCDGYDAGKEPDAIKYAFGTLVDVVAAGHTKWSIVYDIAKREIWYGTAYSKPVKHISFKNLDFKCGGDLMVIDVNIQQEGDVEKYFGPLKREDNLNLLKHICVNYGIDLTEEEYNDVVDHLESFECEVKDK